MAEKLVQRPTPNRFRLRRSMLFLSAQKTSHLQDPTVYGADSLIFDLEDAVAINEKDSARLAMYYAMSYNDYGSTEIVVRINGLDTPFWQEDIRACIAAEVDAIRIPKCETADDVHKVEAVVAATEKEFGIKEGRTLLMAALESPLAILNAYQIAKSSKRLFGITVSGGDLRRTLQTSNSASGIELLFARQNVVYSARAAGVQCFDTVFTNLDDEEGLIKDTTLIKEMGFDGKSLINPRQIKPVHAIFVPTQKEIDRAEKIVSSLKENAQEGVGVFTVDGTMIDIALLQGAQRIINLAKACGIYKEGE
jgi:citrate lyase subunit beta/citryl-CoA lyase